MFEIISSSDTAVDKREINVSPRINLPACFRLYIIVTGKFIKVNISSERKNIPEATLFFVKIDFNIFAVCYTELYTYEVPRVVPLGCCWLPVKRKKKEQEMSAQR